MNDILFLPSTDSQKHSFGWGALTWFANRELGNTESLTLGCCTLKPGQSNPRHYHPNCSEILVVIAGNIRHTATGGTAVEMSPGDAVTIAPLVWHQATNIGAGEAILFIAFSSADRQTVGE